MLTDLWQHGLKAAGLLRRCTSIRMHCCRERQLLNGAKMKPKLPARRKPEALLKQRCTFTHHDTAACYYTKE